jgi:hypothetical protein
MKRMHILGMGLVLGLSCYGSLLSAAFSSKDFRRAYNKFHDLPASMYFNHMLAFNIYFNIFNPSYTAPKEGKVLKEFFRDFKELSVLTFKKLENRHELFQTSPELLVDFFKTFMTTFSVEEDVCDLFNTYLLEKSDDFFSYIKFHSSKASGYLEAHLTRGTYLDPDSFFESIKLENDLIWLLSVIPERNAEITEKILDSTLRVLALFSYFQMTNVLWDDILEQSFDPDAAILYLGKIHLNPDIGRFKVVGRLIKDFIKYDTNLLGKSEDLRYGFHSMKRDYLRNLKSQKGFEYSKEIFMREYSALMSTEEDHPITGLLTRSPSEVTAEPEPT